MKTLLIIILSAIVCGSARPSSAQIGYFDKDAFMASADEDRTIRLGMADCIKMALKNNSEIRIKKISPLIAGAEAGIERARFEPDLAFDFTMEDETELSGSTLTGKTTQKTRTGEFNFGYDQTLVTGTKLSLDFLNTRTRSNSSLQNTNPQFDSSAGVAVTQPLLKGFGLTVNKADYIIAKNNARKSRQEFIQEVMKILTEAKKRYYAFQYSQEQYKAADASLKRVRSLYEINKEKYAKGLASNVDLLESESETARFEEALCEAEKDLKLAEDNLKLVTNLVDDPAAWNADIVILEEVSYEKRELDIVCSITKAFAHRPDYEAAKIELRNKEISVVYRRNGMLPALDLKGSYALNGLGKNYEKDLGHVGSGNYPDWSIGVSVKFPLGSEEEKARYEKAKYEKEQTLITFARLEQKIILEVRDAVRGVDIAYRTLEASEKSRKAERENYAAQEERFKAGLVSTHNIIDYQERLALAELGFIKGVIEYKTGLVELAKAEGATLIEDNIKVE